jgi:hypothetical protein
MIVKDRLGYIYLILKYIEKLSFLLGKVKLG